MDNSAGGAIFALIFGSFYLLLICGSIVLWLISIWLTIACLVDVTNKSVTEFKDRTLWLVLLILSFFIPFGLIIPAVYYFQYKPRMKFWQK